MITEVALITISCVLFVQMGLGSAIEEFLHFRSIVLVCHKCCSFWACLIYLLIAGDIGIVLSIATSFIASYCAQWLALLYDAMAILYNYLYENINQNQGTSEDSERTESPIDPKADSDEVPIMQ